MSGTTLIIKATNVKISINGFTIGSGLGYGAWEGYQREETSKAMGVGSFENGTVLRKDDIIELHKNKSGVWTNESENRRLLQPKT